jgi:hypothetical protein
MSSLHTVSVRVVVGIIFGASFLLVSDLILRLTIDSQVILEIHQQLLVNAQDVAAVHGRLLEQEKAVHARLAIQDKLLLDQNARDDAEQRKILATLAEHGCVLNATALAVGADTQPTTRP